MWMTFSPISPTPCRKSERSAGVTSIISKWNETELKKHPNAEEVDVTLKLIDALATNRTGA